MKFSTEVSDISAELNISVEEANKFLDYWTETNKSAAKMRYEYERTWDTKRRLQRWVRSKFNYGSVNNASSKVKGNLNAYTNVKNIIENE